jgi:hypothetical protein
MRFSSVVLFQGLGPLALHSYWLKSSVDRHLSCSRLAAWAETEVNNKITITIVVCLVMGLHLLYTLTLSVILMSTCFANINLSKSWGRKERSLPFAYSRLLWRCVIQTYCDVISEMLVARISVIFTSRGLRNRPWFRLRARVFLFKCRVSNPSSLIDLSAPHSQTMKPTICCAHWYLFLL